MPPFPFSFWYSPNGPAGGGVGPSALLVIVSWSADKTTLGGGAIKSTIFVRILIDGVLVAQGYLSTCNLGQETSSIFECLVSPVAPGPHTIRAEWSTEATHGEFGITVATPTEGAHLYVREVPLA